MPYVIDAYAYDIDARSRHIDVFSAFIIIDY